MLVSDDDIEDFSGNVNHAFDHFSVQKHGYFRMPLSELDGLGLGQADRDQLIGYIQSGR